MTNGNSYASQLANLLAEKGIRPSPQRIAIYTYLKQHKTHPTVDTVYSALSPDYPTLSRTTVYNTLHLFTQNKLINAVNIEEGETRYDAELEPHIHFKCSQCGTIFDVFDDQLQDIYKKFTGDLPDGFKTEQAEISLWGLCSSCNTTKECN